MDNLCAGYGLNSASLKMLMFLKRKFSVGLLPSLHQEKETKRRTAENATGPENNTVAQGHEHRTKNGVEVVSGSNDRNLKNEVGIEDENYPTCSPVKSTRIRFLNARNRLHDQACALPG